ncbi:helix-turn-helix transcriptional regulator [Paenibacillus agricola]|uniref:AraC family transcriptional regulator n=1 Tax=Paenibacillus agricola TaxID=2716264 RepID=A0ABX0JGZ7_9BACL|nr:AraC family transcriptional regulator [Paenibacillus agricola]NHN35213.1 AraC family transcriptional regulator [Paenibacillus agricola]
MNVGSILTLTPTINFAHRDRADAHVSWGPRTIPDWQFFYVIEGEAELLYDQKQQRIKAGECVLFGPDSPNRLSTVTEAVFYSVHFDWCHPSPEPIHPAYRIQAVSMADFSRAAPVYHMDFPVYGNVAIPCWFDVPELEQIFPRIIKEYQLEQPGYAFVMRALLMELIAILMRHVLDQSLSGKASKIEPALHAMRIHPEEPWTVEQLADLCGYHPIHFTKLFKEEMGRTPKHYLISERMKRAKQMLLGGLSLSNIAEKLKYSSIHYFSHQFKKETGLSPSEFRQQGS